MLDLGFKTITIENWLQMDEIMDHFTARPEDRISALLKPLLNDNVPIEIIKLYEVARGAMIYGHFFYPLFVLGSEQLYRVCETALNTRHGQEGAPKSKKGFKGKIDWLVEHDIIPKKQQVQWHACWDLRCDASHPKSQTLLPPSYAIDTLKITAELINKLFENH